MDDTMTENAFADPHATFGDRLAAAREGTGATVQEIARKLGVKTQTLMAWEDDRSEPRSNRLQMLCGILNVSLVWLLTGEGDGGPSMLMTDDDHEDAGTADKLLAELALLRTEQHLLAERAGRLEKRLRTYLAA